MKIDTELEADEVQNLFDLLNDAIQEHSTESKLKLLSREITVGEHNWNMGHADHLRTIMIKLFGPPRIRFATKQQVREASEWVMKHYGNVLKKLD